MTRRLPTLPLLCALLLALVPTSARAQSPEDLLARLRQTEPPIDWVRAAALRHARVDPAQARLAGRRSRWAGLMPILGLQARRSLARDEGLAPSSREPIKIDLGNDLVLEASATWHLDRLVFDDAELRALREEARLVSERLDLETTVTRLYYERRRAQIEMLLSPAEDATKRAHASVLVEELTATLDALSGGWFVRELKRRRHPLP